ncbi:MAG TPA: AI-2E family transporter [Bryobacteraceae bacterium]|nr:AI-2E family transporter [Bryobacteraceae bacterium]
MLGIDPKAARAAWTVFLLALLVLAAYAIRQTLAVFVIALLFAYLLMPLVGFVERMTPRQVSPRIALAIVYLALVGAIVALGFTLGSRLADEANALAMQLPALVSNPQWMQRVPLPSWLEPARADIIQRVQDELSSGGQQILPYIKGIGGQLATTAKYALYLVLIPILAFFFLKDGAAIRDDFVAALVEERRRPVVDNILEDINLLLGEYIRALVLLALASFTANSIFLAASGAPYAVLLAGISALGEFVPVVGPAAACITVVLVTSLSGYPHVLLYIVFWLLYRLVQDYALSPYLMSKGVQLNPMLVLFGVLAGEQIAGVLGMFLSVPVLAILRVLFVRLRRARTMDLVAPRGEV